MIKSIILIGGPQKGIRNGFVFAINFYFTLQAIFVNIELCIMRMYMYVEIQSSILDAAVLNILK